MPVDLDPFSIQISGLEQVNAKLKKLGPEVQGEVVTAVGNYLLNALANEEVPPYKHVSRAEAYGDMGYGPGFFSHKQRRWFFRALSEGLIKIPYTRRGKTDGVASRWRFVNEDSVDELTLQNDDEAAIFLYDNKRQSRHEALVGWKKIGQIVDERKKKLSGVMSRAVNRAIKKLNLQAK